ncbi:hypothetical protein ACTWPT_40085 [Nonomuraea sp. 3N208]|uniref:hypothetical protein n=1 Tax=Nonomuraea sp. 3N208 TaxID=3457421 RepID=UPI003FD0041D
MDADIRWILAFDASCGRCRGLAEQVKHIGEHRLEIMPLAHPDVVAWREQALGESAPYAPTLIRVGDGGVRAWAGGDMAIRLAAHLGIRGTYSLLRTLGENRKQGETKMRLTPRPEVAVSSSGWPA